jgi:hypothetical protein
MRFQVGSRLRARGVCHGLLFAVAGFAVVAGCTASPGVPAPQGAPPSPRVSGLPSTCTATVTEPAKAAAALDGAKPGDTVCFTGNRLAGLDVQMKTSGTADKPISLLADGTQMRSISVKGEHVNVEGFTLVDGDGLNLEGNSMVARDNVIRNASADGIVCADCHDVTLEQNNVWRADGTGILIDGVHILVRGNTVAQSVMKTRGDADGMRFFGNDLRILGNTVKDIKTTGYPEGEAPHTDCFQTFDSNNRPTYDVVIADNTCENVDVQCLIATGSDSRAGKVPNNVTAVIFEGNTCKVKGSQAILLEQFPNVVIRGNTFAGPEYRAVFLSKGSINTTIVSNTIMGNIAPYEVDEESQPGLRAERNASR